MSHERDLRDLDAALREVSRAVRRAVTTPPGLEPLSAAQLEVLRTIVANPGATPRELAARTGMQPSNMSTTLRDLTAADFAIRETDPADRRSCRIEPTEKARAHTAAVDAAYTELVLDALTEVDEADIARLLAAVPGLQALAAALGVRRR